MKLEVGHLITVLAPAARKWQGRWVVRRTFVLQVERNSYFTVEGGRINYLPGHEGIRWIHGHHTRRSHAGQALLAAGMLVG